VPGAQAGGGLDGGASGQDVVDQDDMFAKQLAGLPDAPGVNQLRLASRPVGSQLALLTLPGQ
jgi:hypothetical protein